MAESLITFLKGDKIGSETDYRDALPVNMYAVSRPMFGADGYMLQMPGLESYATGFGIDRGGYWNDRQDAHFRVSGTKLALVDGGVATALGDVSGTDIASMTHSFNTQAIVADGKYFLYDPVNGFRQVTDPDLGNPIDVVWVDGYYFFTDGEFIYHTDINDESSIDPLKYATAEFIPDFTYGVAKTEDNKVMVFGRYSIEYFINSANDNFAFSRVPSRALKLGIVGTHCKAEVGGKYYVLGGRKEEAISLHVIGVGSAAKLGTREVDKTVAMYSEAELENANIESFEHDGYVFVIINLPNETLLFNETIASKVGIDAAWSILKTGTADTPWRARFGVFDAGANSWVFGDRQDSTIGSINSAVATQYGEMAEWLLYTPFMYLDGASVDEFELETISGFTDQPYGNVFLSLTYDGVTHGLEWTQMFTEKNNYNLRYITRRLGYVSNWFAFKLRGVSRSRAAFGRAKVKYG